MRIAIMAPSFPPAFRGGGPARTLHALTRAMPSSRFEAYVFAPDADTGLSSRLPVNPNAWSTFDGLRTYYASVNRLVTLARMLREVRKLNPEVVYLNSLFNLRLSILPRVLLAFRYLRPSKVLIAPRGELDAGALRIRSKKKRVFLTLYRTLGLHRDVVWHASSNDEARAIRAVWGAEASVLVRENETLLPESPAEPSAHEGPLRAVFYSRLSPKKGLLTALEGLQMVDEAVDFDVYGPAEDPAYVTSCRRAAANAPAGVAIRFLGEVEPERARLTLGEYDVMLFPTAGENFGHVIVEALSASCFVAVSDTTPWSDLLSTGGRVVAPNEPSVWAAAVSDIARLGPAERLELRRAAGAAYREWRSRPSTPHVFELLTDPHREGEA